METVALLVLNPCCSLMMTFSNGMGQVRKSRNGNDNTSGLYSIVFFLFFFVFVFESSSLIRFFKTRQSLETDFNGSAYFFTYRISQRRRRSILLGSIQSYQSAKILCRPGSGLVILEIIYLFELRVFHCENNLKGDDQTRTNDRERSSVCVLQFFK